MTMVADSVTQNDQPRRSCPTSLSEFDDNSTISSTGINSGPVVDISIQKNEEPNITPRSPSNRSSRHRRTVVLPALEEAPGSSHMRSSSSMDSLPPSPRTQASAKLPPQFTEDPGLDHDEVNLINDKASRYALRGNEKKALKTYKRALRLTRIEVARIDRQLRDAQNQPTYLKTTINIVLHDEWTTVALIIAEIRTMMAIIYERIGDYNRAIHCCNEAKDVYHRQSIFDKKHCVRDSNSEMNSARMSHMAMKMEDARDTYKVRQQLHEEAAEIHRELVATKDVATKDLFFENIFDKLSAALALELESLGENHPQVSDTMAFLSKLYLERSQVEKALGTMKRAVAMAEVSLGTTHPRTGEKYYDIARMYERIKRNKEDSSNAIEYYEKAVDTYKEADGDYSRLTGSILNDVGVLHIQREEYDLAVQRLSDALAAYESSIEESRGMFADTSQVWRNLAECYVLRKQWDSATMAFKSAIDVQHDARKLYDTAARDNDKVAMPPLVTDESIGDTFRRLGKTYAAQRKYNDSFVTLTEALTIYQNAYDKAYQESRKDKSVDLSSKQDQVASIIYCIAEVKEADEQFDEAIKLYEESLQLRISSDKQRKRGNKLNHVHCAMCLAGIGSIRMAKCDYSLSFKAYNKALQCTRRQSKYTLQV